MKTLNCPLNGIRNISEFACLGEVKRLPDPAAGMAAWASFAFFERNPAGHVREWWMHVPTNYVFIVERDTRTDETLATYPIGGARLQHAQEG